MIYQHEARGADRTITDAIDTHVQAEQARPDDDDDGPTGVLVPAGPLMARTVSDDPRLGRAGLEVSPLTCGYTIERVTGIEPALSAWESAPSGPVTWPDLRGEVSASDREGPLVTGVNGSLMARRS